MYVYMYNIVYVVDISPIQLHKLVYAKPPRSQTLYCYRQINHKCE